TVGDVDRCEAWPCRIDGELGVEIPIARPDGVFHYSRPIVADYRENILIVGPGKQRPVVVFAIFGLQAFEVRGAASRGAFYRKMDGVAYRAHSRGNAIVHAVNTYTGIL